MTGPGDKVVSAERELIEYLEKVAHKDLASLRRSIALGGLLQGSLDIDTAAALAHLPRTLLERLLPSEDRARARLSRCDRPDDAPFISVVVPLYNEQENLPELKERLLPVLRAIGTYEIVFVDDGSSDASANIVLGFRTEEPGVKLIRLSRNFGHQAALSAGLDHASGQVVVLMDADLQDPPEIVPELVAKWKEGHAVVYAIRERRQEGLPKRLSYHLFYRALRRVADIDIPLDAGDFCLMDRRIVDAMRLLPEKHRFLRGLRSWLGYSQVGVRYARPARFKGQAKYTWRKLVKLALDGLLAFTTVPLRLAVYVGFLTATFGLGYMLYAIAARLFWRHVPPGWTSLTVVVLLLGGIQLVLIGILGEYVGRTFDEVKSRPVYIVDRTYGMDGDEASDRDGAAH